MASRPNRSLSPERMASVRLYGRAKTAGWTHRVPVGEERARIIAELQEIAAPFPHLLGELAGIFLGAAQNDQVGGPGHLISAQLLIDAGADLAEVERWTQIGYERTRFKPGPNYPPGPRVRDES